MAKSNDPRAEAIADAIAKALDPLFYQAAEEEWMVYELVDGFGCAFVQICRELEADPFEVIQHVIKEANQ